MFMHDCEGNIFVAKPTIVGVFVFDFQYLLILNRIVMWDEP